MQPLCGHGSSPHGYRGVPVYPVLEYFIEDAVLFEVLLGQ